MQHFSAAALLLALVLTGCPEAPAGWQRAFDPGDAGAISGVWGSGPDDVFAVGGAQKGAVFHFDGTAWSRMPMPDAGLLVWSYGFGPDDVFAVGVGGSALHYDGHAWTKLDTGTTDDLWGVFGFSRDDLWVVGGNAYDGPPVLLHWDGAHFSPVALDAAANPVKAKAIFKVWGTGGKLFAVGQRGLILEYAGGRWNYVAAGANADDDFVSLWGTSATHIVAVGGRGNGRVALFDGSAWNTLAPSGLGGLNAVFLWPTGEAFAGGTTGLAGPLDLATGKVTREPTGTSIDIHAMWGDGRDRLYAVGGDFLAPYRGVALVRTIAHE